MKKNDNQSKPNTLYDKPARMWFEVTADVYESYVRECNTYRKKKQDHCLCSCPQNKWWLCDMVCMDYEFCKTCAISLDAPQGDDEDTTLMDAIPDGRTLLEDDTVDRDLLARPQRTFADQMKRYRTELRKIRGY